MFARLFPEVQGYKPIQLHLAEASRDRTPSLSLPNSKYLPGKPSQEARPGFRGKFRIGQDLT